MVKIHPVGRLGNQMFQYMGALKLKDLVPQLEICGYNMPQWGLYRPAPADFPADSLWVWDEGQYTPFRQIAGYLRFGLVRYLTWCALGLHMSNLKDVDYYRDVFAAPALSGIDRFGPEHIVISVRGAEILGNHHADYGPVPLSLIDQAVEVSGAQPVFVGQLADDRYSAAIRRRYPDAIYRASRGALADFQTLRLSKQLVVAVSTFSWLAAWLSDADKIHFPVSGMFHPRQRPDFDLLPSDDERYVFYECEPRKWAATQEDFAYLEAPRRHAVLPRSDVDGLREAARAAIRPGDRRRRRALARAAYVHAVRSRIRRIVDMAGARAPKP